MKIVSWNVNGLKSIIEKNFESISSGLSADIMCLQEIKITKDIVDLKLDGYYKYFNYSKKAGYAGVAIFTKRRAENVLVGMKFENEEEEIEDLDEESRVLTLEYDNFYLVNVYVPCLKHNQERAKQRMEFDKTFYEYIKKLNKIKDVIICGDFNVCHQKIDACLLDKNRNFEVFSDEQKADFDELLEQGFLDTYRYMHPQTRKYTFWTNDATSRTDYKVGWRLDYILVSENLRKNIRQANILTEIMGSDHCPIELVIRLENEKNNGSHKYKKNEVVSQNEHSKNTEDIAVLGKMWRSYDFEQAEKKLFDLQCRLTKATLQGNKAERIHLQDLITNSTEAKMLAVRKVSEISKAGAGIDGVIWRKDSDKMKAAMNLNTGTYQASPLRQFIFKDQKSSKQRQIGIPTVYDRAMQVLYAYSLEPVAEAIADRKSFAFRKGRSSEQAHAFIMGCLTAIDAPEWILVTDISSYYDTISHNWLRNHIPMTKSILKEFLNTGFVLDGELFNREVGISLGSNLSTILGNMTLDGLQRVLYELQGKKTKDYKDGWCLRFADDILITARTKENAEKFKKEVVKFVSKRGLMISERKTKIVNIKEGFEFLARFYCKIDGVIRCVPSAKSVSKFEQEVEELIFKYKEKWSQSKLIQAINRKISGYVTYHKCEESTDVFKHLDVVINMLLLKLMRELHSEIPREKLIKRYWKIDSEGRSVFTLVGHKEKSVKIMADTVLVTEQRIDLSKNVFLNRNYFEELEKDKDIQNCAGRYKKVWDRQEGKCYVCSKEIKKEQEKDIIFKKISADKTIRNLAYVHKHCKDSIVEYADVGDEDIKSICLRELLEEIDDKKARNSKESKFINLTDYFHNLRKNDITLTFKEMEKILGFPLCDSAYKYKKYFYYNKSGVLSESWTSQGYKIKKVDMEKQKIEFERFDFRRTKVIIPKFMYRLDLPYEMIEETKIFFLHLQEKYRLK